MTRFVTPKLAAYAWLGVVGLLAGLLFGQAVLVALGIPFLALLLAGLALAREPVLEARARLDRERAVEGELVQLEVDVEALAPLRDVELKLRLPSGLALEGGSSELELSLAAGQRHTLTAALRCVRWGGYQVGNLSLRARDRLGFLAFESPLELSLPLRVYPTRERLRAILRPLRTQAHAGNEVSRLKGDGIEFADVRAFEAGDRVRQVNWRVSARRGALHVNQHHPERNTDVILFIDTFAEVENAGVSSLDLAVRGAASLATRYLERRDRVGVVGFGGIIRWLQPAMGWLQLYRLLESVLDTRVVLSHAWKIVDVVPRGVLTPQALVIALTPLLDERGVAALLDVRGRGFDVAVIEIDPLSFVTPRPGELGELSHRLWMLRRDALRDRFRRAGVPVALWRPDLPLQGALEEVRGFRRRPALARA